MSDNNKLKLYECLDKILEFDYRYNEEFLDKSYAFNKRKPQDNKFKKNKKIESMVEGLDVSIKHYKSKFIHFNPLMNEIDIVYPEYFIKKEYYYFALLHEITHWTGNFCETGRCDEFLEKVFKDTLTVEEHEAHVIREEAVANITAYLLCKHFNVNIEFEMLMAQLIIESNWDFQKNQVKFLKDLVKDILTIFNFLNIELK